MAKIYFIGWMLISLIANPAITRAQNANWYKCFSGTIGKAPITLHLHKMGPSYAGYYYYNTSQQPIYMLGDDTTTGTGGIKLYVFVPGDLNTNEIFLLNVSGNKCSGEWRKEEKAKGIPVTTTEKTIMPLHFDMLFIRGTAQLRPGMKESPEASYEAGTIWPGEKTTAATTIRSFIGESFGQKGNQPEINKLLLEEKDKFINGWIEDNKNVPDSEMIEYPFTYNMEESRWLIVAYQTPKLLILADWYYTYSGGAHGNSNSSFISFDLTRAKKIELDDVLLPAGIKKLDGLLEKYFRKSQGLKKDEELTEAGLFENKIEHNDNFYVTAKGIGFNYAPYEIAAYAFGGIDVFIPFTELNIYLQPGFKKLIQ